MVRLISHFCSLSLLGLLALATPADAAHHRGQVRHYYIAADEIDWDYIPTGHDGMMPNMPPSGYAKFYAESGRHLIGRRYRKAVFREYTDSTFRHLKPRPPEEAYLGLLGPILRAEVGDTIEIVFRNNGTHPYSMHPHGVFYEKPSEGAPYEDGVAAADKGGASVAPGKSFTYVWSVPPRAGPGPSDPSSIVWLYHSHANERKDVNTGLIGAIIVTRRGSARPDGRPRDVDREFVDLFMIVDESESWFLDDNVRRFAGDPKHTDVSEFIAKDPEGRFDSVNGTGTSAQNQHYTINGYSFANMPMMQMRKGEHVRWYLLSLGEAGNTHTPHWHGNTVLLNGQRTDVVEVTPAQMVTADMVPDDPGIWLFHCHVSDHMDGGMVARYQVLP
jgi:FtsP/CotA-like multicopper oxidase with cupredoxin domain